MKNKGEIKKKYIYARYDGDQNGFLWNYGKLKWFSIRGLRWNKKWDNENDILQWNFFLFSQFPFLEFEHTQTTPINNNDEILLLL